MKKKFLIFSLSLLALSGCWKDKNNCPADDASCTQSSCESCDNTPSQALEYNGDQGGGVGDMRVLDQETNGAMDIGTGGVGSGFGGMGDRPL